MPSPTLNPVGISFISQGFSEFTKNIGQAGLAILGLGQATDEGTAALNSLATGMDNLNKLGVDTTVVGKKLKEGVGQLGKEAERSGNLLKNYFADIFNKAISGIKAGWTVGSIAGTIVGLIQPELMLATQLIGGMLGALAGLFPGIAVGIVEGVYNLYRDVAIAIAGMLGKLVKNIVQAGFGIADAFIAFGKRIYGAIKSIISTLKGVFDKLISTFFGIFTGASAGGIRGGWRGLSDSIFGAMVKFEILKQVVRGIIREIKDFASAAFNAAVEVQTLTVRLDNLISMQIREAGITQDVGESMKIAATYTADLMHWIQKMALATPVSLEEVSKTVSLSIAMGWAVDEAKKLTKTIIDYTSATGLSSDVTERIIFNFAQMKNAGKVTGTELRDLARGAFMPINDILKIMYKNLGDTTMSFEEFRDAAASGTVEVEGFFKAFEDFVAINMPDAAYKMNYTFAAVMDNLKDLFKVMLGWNVFGPMIKSITEPLQKMIENIATDENMARLNAIGKALAYLIESIRYGFGSVIGSILNLGKAFGIAAPTIDNVVKTIIKFGLFIRWVGDEIAKFINVHISPLAKELGDKVGGTFEGMSEDMFGWGVNLIVNFARGMVEAAASILVKAINYITNILTSWFKPGSPPKILPDIDKWGTDTINEWLHGFTQADFSALDSLQSAVKDALGALVNLGAITDVQSGQMYLDLSVELIRAFDEFNRTGQITTNIFDELRNIGGAYGREISELLGLQLELTIATERTTKAQKDYDDAVKASAKSEVKANRLIKEYNAMVRKGASKKQLREKLKIVNAAEQELDVNKKAEIVKKNDLELAQEQQKQIEETVKLQETLIKQLTELTQAQADAASGAAQSATAVAEEFNSILAGLGDPSTWPSLDFEGLFEDAKKEFSDTMLIDIPNIWDNAWNTNFGEGSKFQEALGRLWDVIVPKFSETTAKLKTAWDTFAQAVHLPSWDEIASAWEGTPEPLVQLGKNIEDPGGAPQNGGFIARLTRVFQTFAQDIKANGGLLATLGDIAKTIILGLFDKIVSEIEDPQSASRTFLGDIMTRITDALFGQQAAPNGTIGAENFKAESPGTRILNWILAELDNAVTVLGPDIAEIGSKIGGTIITAIGDGIKTKINEIFQSALSSPMGEIFTKIAGFFGMDLTTGPFEVGKSTVGENVGKSLVASLGEGIRGALQIAMYTGGVIFTAITQFITNLLKMFGLGADATAKSTPGINSPFYIIGRAIVQGIIDGFNSMIQTFKDNWNALVSLLPEQLRDKLWMKSPSRLMAKMGRNVVVGLANGIAGSSYMVEDAMNQVIANRLLPSIKMTAPVSAPPVYAGNTVNFGDVNINNNMDWAMFKAQVQRAIIG